MLLQAILIVELYVCIALFHFSAPFKSLNNKITVLICCNKTNSSKDENFLRAGGTPINSRWQWRMLCLLSHCRSRQSFSLSGQQEQILVCAQVIYQGRIMQWMETNNSQAESFCIDFRRTSVNCYFSVVNTFRETVTEF